MKIELSEKSIEQLADRLALLLKGEDIKPQCEFLTTKEVAGMLKISADRVRKLKDKFPHVKSGGKDQGKLLFLKSAIMDNF